MFTKFFYQWNEKRTGIKLKRSVTKPIYLHQDRYDETDKGSELFGIGVSSTRQVSDDLFFEGSSNSETQKYFSYVSETTTTYVDLSYILSCSTSAVYLLNNLQALNAKTLVDTRLLHLLPCSLMLFSHPEYETRGDEEHRVRLNRSLEGHCLQYDNSSTPSQDIYW